MDTLDWQGSRNAFGYPMRRSIENGLGIITFTRNALYEARLNPDPGFGIIFDETDTVFQKILAALGISGSKKTGKEANTDNLEVIFTLMKVKLDSFDDATRAVAGKGTLIYNAVWGANRNRFYEGSYEERMSALLALATAMHDYPTLAAAEDLVRTYYESIKAGRTSQQGSISGFKIDNVLVASLMETAILQMDRDLGWLKFFYAKLDKPQAMINTYFDLSKIITHESDKAYPCIAPKAGFVKVCIHTFKITDKVKIEVDGPEDILLCLKMDGKEPCGTSAYRARSGTVLTLPVMDVFPDLTGRQVIGTNTSMVDSSHFIFSIIEA